jgi:hypothetical protein
VPYHDWKKQPGPEQQQEYLMRLFEYSGVLQSDQPASPKLLRQQQQQQQPIAAEQQQQDEQQQQHQQPRQPLQDKSSRVKATARALLRRSGLQPRDTSTISALVGTHRMEPGGISMRCWHWLRQHGAVQHLLACSICCI